MPLGETQAVRQELLFIERVTQVYRRRIGTLIDRMNAHTSRPSDLECIRLCVEAVDLVLSSQATLASALDRSARKQAA